MTPTVYIVTPSFNAAGTIDRTIHSVLSQAGDFRIRYHVQDGGSTDGTLDRIEAWKQRFKNSFPRQCQGIEFTVTSERDSGMYDAIVRGFSALNAGYNDFMTWINADDMLMPGSVALAATLSRQFPPDQLSWFGGAISIFREDMNVISYDRPIPRFALREGLCDGVHWDFVQQEGTYFRKWLWEKIDAAESIGNMKLAGDWNLWRRMATFADFAQIAAPTGGFRIRPGQLSAKQRDKYLLEIESILPSEERKRILKRELTKSPILRNLIKASTIWQLKDEDETKFFIHTLSIDAIAAQRHKMVFKESPEWLGRPQPEECVFAEGKVGEFGAGAFESMQGKFVYSAPGIFGINTDWQFPAITEKHAFERIRSSVGNLAKGLLYIPYPWATLIDKLESRAKDAASYLKQFEQFCHRLPPATRKVTVCQHIFGRKYIDLFRQAGITDVFWSHATQEEVARTAETEEDIRFHPFPLYPVQVLQSLPQAGPEADAAPRPYLFSFIGARANQYYLTEARNWILDLLKDDPRGLIVGRDGWHYQKVVYDHQIKGDAAQSDLPTLVDTSAADQFRASLVQSTFSLCPAGSGPNSIRLWESLGAGSIPVILADTWAPPGDRRLWDMAAVFCKETPDDIRALPDRLAALAAEPGRLEQMRHAMRQLWLLYGPHAFVSDLQDFLLDHLASPAPVERTGDPLAQALARQDEAGLLQACAGALLLDPAATQARIAADAVLARALEAARAQMAEGALLAGHYDAVLAHARQKALPPRPIATPSVQRGAVPKVCRFGKHANRTPLSYAPIRRLIGDRLQDVEDPAAADLVVTGFCIDLRDGIDSLSPALKQARAPKFAVISEEPLWDITWSGPFTGDAGRVSANGTEIAYAFLGHETSAIYDFHQLPYFVLTSNSYAVRYAHLMARFAGLSCAALLDRWKTAALRAAFFAEYRKGEAYARTHPERHVTALSSYRTEVAEAVAGEDVLRMGKGWGEAGPRQALPDWHLDKLAWLDGRTRVLGAFENVHQRLYISEKIFDAFAVGAVPAYWADAGHRIFDLVPAEAMLNCHGLAAPEAASRIAGFRPDSAFADAWLATAARLAALFGNGMAVQAERHRVAEAVVKAVEALV